MVTIPLLILGLIILVFVVLLAEKGTRGVCLMVLGCCVFLLLFLIFKTGPAEFPSGLATKEGLGRGDYKVASVLSDNSDKVFVVLRKRNEWKSSAEVAFIMYEFPRVSFDGGSNFVNPETLSVVGQGDYLRLVLK